MEAIEKYDACVAALEAFARNAGFAECVLGLSGGIDSALVAAMCVDAFGPANVHAVMLPGPYSSEGSITDAAAEAEALGIDCRSVSIVEPYEAFARVLDVPCGSAFAGLTGQNVQARCRMVVLMALSNAHGWMLVNTGNKSEAMMGYSTLYGDTAGAFAPIGGLYKTDVYAAARARNDRAREQDKVPPIPENVLVKPPSAELAPGQRDEEALGIMYAELDPILIAHFEHGMDAARIAELPEVSRSEEEVAAIIARAEGYAFKRAVEPPFPQVKFY